MLPKHAIEKLLLAAMDDPILKLEHSNEPLTLQEALKLTRVFTVATTLAIVLELDPFHPAKPPPHPPTQSFQQWHLN